jgi:uncharacterized membrane protein YfcA
VYVFGLDPKDAIASSLLVVAVASTIGAAQHARAGNVRLREGLVFGMAGMIGAFLGGRVSAFIDGGVLLLLFASMMTVTALAMWRGRRAVGQQPGEPDVGVDLAASGRLAAQGVVVGSFTGLIGAGGGFLIVPALALWARLPMPAAIGTSLTIIVMQSLAGFAGHVGNATIDPKLVGAVSVIAVGGTVIGALIAKATDPARLRRAFAGFVLAMAGFILVREGTLVVQTAGQALPQTIPQLVFATVMLGVGLWTGRATRRAEQAVWDLDFEQGEGI